MSTLMSVMKISIPIFQPEHRSRNLTQIMSLDEKCVLLIDANFNISGFTTQSLWNPERVQIVTRITCVEHVSDINKV